MSSGKDENYFDVTIKIIECVQVQLFCLIGVLDTLPFDLLLHCYNTHLISRFLTVLFVQ